MSRGRFTALSTITMVTSPALGIPAQGRVSQQDKYCNVPHLSQISLIFLRVPSAELQRLRQLG